MQKCPVDALIRKHIRATTRKETQKRERERGGTKRSREKYGEGKRLAGVSLLICKVKTAVNVGYGVLRGSSTRYALDVIYVGVNSAA